MSFSLPTPANPSPMTPTEIAAFVGGTLRRDGSAQIGFVTAVHAANETHAAWFSGKPDLTGRKPSDAQWQALADSGAGVLLLHESVTGNLPPNAALIDCANPGLAAAKLAQRFVGVVPPSQPGVHPSAIVDASAQIGQDVSIGPGCVVEAGAHLDDGVVLQSRVSVGANAKLGKGSYLYSGVVVYHDVELGAACVVHSNSVLGADGFGYSWSGSRHEKVPQTGGLVIADGVEIGACSAIDRGTFEPTQIGMGCIIDNHVQIGHNCQIGAFVVLCGQVAIAGSTVIGDGAILGGRSGSGGHCRIGAGVQMAGLAVAFSDIPDGAIVAGAPAVDANLDMRGRAILRKMARKRGRA